MIKLFYVPKFLSIILSRTFSDKNNDTSVKHYVQEWYDKIFARAQALPLKPAAKIQNFSIKENIFFSNLSKYVFQENRIFAPKLLLI